MKAVRFDGYGGIEVLQVADVPMPEPTHGEVSPRQQQDHAALEQYLRRVEVLDFPDEAAIHYAQIRAALKARGADDLRERSLHRGACPFSQGHARDQQYRGVRSRPRPRH